MLKDGEFRGVSVIEFKRNSSGKYIGVYSEYYSKKPINFTITVSKNDFGYGYILQDNNSDFHIRQLEAGNNLASACFHAGFKLVEILIHHKYR